MAVSNVAIANRAIQLLGSPERIEALDQDSPNAHTMSAAFNAIRNALLRRYKWNFAKTRISIAADAAQTVWGGLNRFPLPANYARLIRDNETGRRLDWKIEGRFIVTADAAPLDFKYVAIVTDPAEFDPLFDEVFAYKLAIATCEEVTGSTSKMPELKDGFKDAMNAAKQGNAYEEDAEEALEDDWILARF